ncbi:MAG TPA: hypothetical protein VLW06_07095 [Terriglobales bacterium]|nr:hypothetical protein [Terriglobales bacterium]
MTVGKLLSIVCLCALALPAFAGVYVTSPGNGATSGSPVHFVATATSPACSKGVAAMGIYTAPGKLAYTVNGASLNTNLSMSNGTYNVVVQSWDNCGWSGTQPLTLTVGGSSGGSAPAPSSGGKVFSSLQKSGGWTGYALLPPGFGICSGCNPGGSNVSWSWNQNVGSPSMDGASTKAAYNGGSTQWADILWNNHLIGDFSSQGLPDTGKTLAPSLHNFTYDVYFWVGNVSNSQALEFDINQFVNGKSYIWGHECRIDGGHEWDTWSNPGGHWVASGVACNPVSNAWNHLTINVQRTSDGHLLFHTITLNGKTATVNRYDTPTSTSWYGITVNYQMDSDYNKTAYPVYLDKFTFTAQ